MLQGPLYHSHPPPISFFYFPRLLACTLTFGFNAKWFEVESHSTGWELLELRTETLFLS